MSRLLTEADTFYRRWIVANGLAESAGLGTTFLAGRALAPLLERATDALAIVGSALLAVLFGTILEGALVGVAQACVLRRRLAGLRSASWVAATSAGAGLAWALGMIPSTVISLTGVAEGHGAASQPGPALQYALAMGLGLLVGPILGVAQWAVLRRHVTRAASWLWANALAWAVGMPLIFLGMDFVPWDGAPAGVALAIYAVCAAAGAVVGAIHGRVLVALVASPRAAGCVQSRAD